MSMLYLANSLLSYAVRRSDFHDDEEVLMLITNMFLLFPIVSTV